MHIMMSGNERRSIKVMVAGGAGNSACQISKVGLCLSRLPSTQKEANQKNGGSGSTQQNISFFVQNTNLSPK